MGYVAANDGTRLCYKGAGSGTPILFIHEFAGDHRSWEPQLRFFARSAAASPITRAAFRPRMFRRTARATRRRQARDDAIAVLDHLKIERARVVGQLTDAMRKIEVPALIVTGDEDDPCLEPALHMKRHMRTPAWWCCRIRGIQSTSRSRRPSTARCWISS